MTQYLISFDDGAMTFPEEELPDVAEAAHAVAQEGHRRRARWLPGDTTSEVIRRLSGVDVHILRAKQVA